LKCFLIIYNFLTKSVETKLTDGAKRECIKMNKHLYNQRKWLRENFFH